MEDACLPWNVSLGRRLLPDVCGRGVSRIASAVVCSQGGGGGGARHLAETTFGRMTLGRKIFCVVHFADLFFLQNLFSPVSVR